ncbi:MAG TPA: imidazole glycerol phosphate synthase subunit HisH [Candidatus Binatia bacterium]|nr:imidazole glycerol phosphate synthase subunit HisH [Candidatus Binatia bacterium]
MKVAVCDYGAGNVRSVVAALRRLGVDARVTDDADAVAAADLAVLPGVGSARSAIARLRETRVDETLRARTAPTLGICLGLQLALDHSEEDGGVLGLRIVPGRAVRLRGDRVPRIGWAPLDGGRDSYYFAHSYAAETPAAVATSEGIVAEVRHGSFIGVQFHPEKSGAAGARWLERCLSHV